ncbi:hypothetical protein [Xanthomarina sp. F2636L]|uniref:hypothetical protein n=1 Tax=Xanthomarina sp. F2636L TaxID=2996018 RepID=UPI00225E6B27|nr:hypothetical protein [Xanthomarina sp. F2636L]MCX7551853.1 hypothetical protein [Xanthomarina sp. F2636L]
MKTIQILSKTVFIAFLFILNNSCSSDDNPLNENPDPQEESHFYELTFTGGATDGDVFSGTISNTNGSSGVSAVRTLTTNGEGDIEDRMILSLLDEVHSPNISIGMALTMNNNQALDYGPNVNETSSGMSITYGNYVMNSISGSSNITDYGEQTVYTGVTYAHFKITFTADMQVGYINQADTFTTQVTGSITVKRPVFN